MLFDLADDNKLTLMSLLIINHAISTYTDDFAVSLLRKFKLTGPILTLLD